MKIKRKFIIAMACIVSLVMCNVLDFANVNLKSYAVAAIFQITYDANGGVNPPEPQRDIIDGTVVLLKDKEGMTKPGFKFDGWTRDRHNTGKVYRPYEKFKMPRENVTFYGREIGRASCRERV